MNTTIKPSSIPMKNIRESYTMKIAADYTVADWNGWTNGRVDGGMMEEWADRTAEEFNAAMAKRAGFVHMVESYPRYDGTTITEHHWIKFM
jgi:hypothetical protein